MQGVQELFYYELKASESNNIQCTVNSCDQLNSTSLFGYDVHQKDLFQA